MTKTTVQPPLDETMELSSTAEKNQTVQKHLEEVLVIKQKLADIKENFNKIIDAIAHNPSLFSRAASYWGTLPLWQKIIAGIILIVPLFIIGVAVQLFALLSTSIFTLITYTTSSLLLDNHHNQNENSAEQLKASVGSLADALGTVILSLDTLREQLTLEIKQFQKENEQLAVHVSTLKEQILTLSNQAEQLKDTEQKLRSTLVELNKTKTTLESSIQEQSSLLQQSQSKLEQVIQEFQANQTQLSNKIIELNQVNIEMGLAVENGKKVSSTLEGVVETLSKTVIADEQQRVTFQHRLNDFLSNKEKSFDQVAERICEAELKLEQVRNELTQSNQKYRELLDRHEQQVIRLERLDDVQATAQTNPARKLKTLGLFALDAQTIQQREQQLPEPLHTVLSVH